MRRNVRWVALAVLLLFILGGLAGFRHVSKIRFVAGSWVVRVPFGEAPDQVKQARGIDGRTYGPLTFAANGKNVVVADSYHQQLLYFSPGHVDRRPLEGAMIEDLSLNRQGQVLATDNRTLSVWLLNGDAKKRIVALTHWRGYTEALWKVNWTPKGNVLLEWIQFGRGSFATRLQEYSAAGRLMRTMAESFVSPNDVRPLSLHPMSAAPIRNFQVAPNGSVYIEPQQMPSHTPTIRVYGANGLYLRTVVIGTQGAARAMDFLGVDRRGWIYVALNITIPHEARVLVVDNRGRTIANIPVQAVPVHAATYGQVLPSGKLYLDQSSATHYRLRVYRPLFYKVWQWRGF